MPSKHSGLSRKTADGVDVSKRIVIVNPEKCKPNSPAFQYLKRYAGSCGKDCIQVQERVVKVSESACATCVSRCKQCPGDVISVVKLPTNLTKNTTHRYGPNAFKLHGLPLPRRGHVLGLLGANGTGKSTALSILMGRTKPNLGKLDPPAPEWSDIVLHYRGSDLQNYFAAMLNNNLTVAIKPQLEASFARRMKGKVVRDMIQNRDERGKMNEVVTFLELGNLLDREVQHLSGGELQRFAVACTIVKNADVYMFDEVSSFLDVRQRLRATECIRSLVHGGDEQWDNKMTAMRKYVIVVEHDLAVLDYMSDFVQCLYGKPGAYGVVTQRSRVRNGINQFLAGYLPTENMRFRDHELSFKMTVNDFNDAVEDNDDCNMDNSNSEKKERTGIMRYPPMSKTHVRVNGNGEEKSRFTLNVKAGDFRDGEVVLLLGENGSGKTTLLELLAGRTTGESSIGSQANGAVDGVSPRLAAMGISYKTQGLNPKMRRFKGTVQEYLEATINRALMDRLFHLLVLRPLKVDDMKKLSVSSMSGGEMQRLSIAVCLGTPAPVYLIDEPSAGLDCEQRVIAAKVMKRWIVNHLGRTCFLVEHDFVMAAAMADRVIVFEGAPGVECSASTPVSVADGFNKFLQTLGVTIRLDPLNSRPRINKKGSRGDRAQKNAGQYYLFEAAAGGIREGEV